MKLEYEHLLHKKFQLGVQDCFTMCRNFYKDNFSIDMPDIARPNNWEADNLDLINKFYHLTGFKKLDLEENWPPRPGDVLVTTIGGSTPNHLVICLDSNLIMHHQYMTMSRKELMRPVWKRFTSFILRHPDVPDLRPEKPKVVLEEMLLEKYI